MIALLAKVFIKDRRNYSDGTVRKKYGTLTGITGIVLNVFLFIGKFIAGSISGAISIMADAFNNLSDAGSSVISLAGFMMADKKPDPDHPFGHGRMEYISGLFVSVLIIMMGFELGKTSVSKIMSPEMPSESILAVIIPAAAILVKLYMFAYNRIYGRRINSASMKATALDSISDVVATSVVLISILLTKFFRINIDGYAGLAVSVFILITGIKSIKETVDPLLGKKPDPEFVNRIQDIVMSYDEIIGIHDLVVHDYGPGRCMISLHGEVSEEGNLIELHDAIDRCERELHDTLGCEAVIHMDPISVNDERVISMRNAVTQMIQNEVLCSATLKGVYGQFQVLKTSPIHSNALRFLTEPDEKMIRKKKRKGQELTDPEAEYCLKQILNKEALEPADYMDLLLYTELNPAVAAHYIDEIRSKIEIAPDEIKKYIKYKKGIANEITKKFLRYYLKK